MISKKTYYALKALIQLGKLNAVVEKPVLINSIIEKDKLPKKFVESILIELKQSGVIKSKMGKGGGYYFTKSPKDIGIGSIMRTLEGPIALIPCASKTAYESCSNCQDETTCSIRFLFQSVRDEAAKILDSTSLEDLLAHEKKLEYLVSQTMDFVI